MISIKLAFFLLAPIFGLISFFTLRHYNSGLGGSLRSKTWALRIGILSGICFIVTIVFYFISADFELNIKITNKNLDRFFTLLNGLILIGGIIQNARAKSE